MTVTANEDAQHGHGHAGYRHEAVFYSGTDGFLAAMVPFLQGAIDSREASLVVLAAEKNRMLENELAGDTGVIRFMDMALVGLNPARIIPAWRQFVVDHAGHGRLRGIGEPIWPERTPDEMIECQHHESLLNVAIPDAAPLWLACPYDTTRLPDDVLEEARRSHPYLSEEGRNWQSDSYLHPSSRPGPFSGELAPPATAPDELSFGVNQLGELRRFISGRAAALGLEGSRLDDLILAASELAANSVRHGGGEGMARIWPEGGKVLCEIHDSGEIHAPLAGRENPGMAQPSGRGLWLVNHLCDLVQIRSGPGATVTRLHISLA